MTTNDNTNNKNSQTGNAEAKTAAEKISLGAKATSTNEDIVKLARRQKAEFDQERDDWELKDKERAKSELELLRENSLTKKELSDLKKEVEALKFKSVLDRELNAADEQSNKSGEAVKLTPDQKVNQIFMEVIRERKEKALKNKEKKTDNVYYV